ncbi:MAG: hypothetical protein KKI20_05115 [Gammaproteobacteria bacterium]|nr:hypothetical protein [Gammaproteobacteria bacterium]
MNSLASTWTAALFDRLGQRKEISCNSACYIRKHANGLKLIFHARLSSEGQRAADHSFVYLLTQKEDGVYGEVGRTYFTPYLEEFRRIYLFGALFGNHLFPLEAPELLFINNFEDRLVLDDYLQQLSKISQQELPAQIYFIQSLENVADRHLHACAVLAVLQELKNKKVIVDPLFDFKKDYLQRLLQHREGVHFLDYVLGYFYTEALEEHYGKNQSQKVMFVLIHKFLPMMLERKIVFPYLWHVGYSVIGKKIIEEPFTIAFEELQKRYRNSNLEKVEEIKTHVEKKYENDRRRGLHDLDFFLIKSRDAEVNFFLKALSSQGDKSGDYSVAFTPFAGAQSVLGTEIALLTPNVRRMFFVALSDGYRVHIWHRFFCLSARGAFLERNIKWSSFPFLEGSSTYRLTFSKEKHLAKIQFEGLVYTLYDNKLGKRIASKFERHQFLGSMSNKQRLVLNADTPMPEDPEQYLPYFQRLLFSYNSSGVKKDWTNYYLHYAYLSLAVRPTFLNSFSQGYLLPGNKRSIFTALFQRQLEEFFQKNDRESLRKFCFQLSPNLRVFFYRQLKSYVNGTNQDANKVEQSEFQEGLAELEKRQPNGDDLIVLDRDFRWREQLRSFTSNHPRKTIEQAKIEGTPVITFKPGESFLFSDKAYSWLFDKNGEIRPRLIGRKGTPYVLPVCPSVFYSVEIDIDQINAPVFEMVWPDMPSFMMQELTRRIFGEGLLPRVTMVRMDYRGKTFAVEIREHIPGKLLSNVLKESPDDLDQINSVSFTRNFLLSLLLLISELHGRNAVLQLLEDSSFDFKILDACAFKEQGDALRFEIRNIFLLFNLMNHPYILDPYTLQKFLALDFDAVLPAWVEACRMENKRLFMLFGEHIKQLYPQGEEELKSSQPMSSLEKLGLNPSLLCIPIGGFVSSLFFRAKKMQGVLIARANESPLNILRRVLPLAHQFYQSCFAEKVIQERFNILDRMTRDELSISPQSDALLSLPMVTYEVRGITEASRRRRYPFPLTAKEVWEVAQEFDDFFCPSQASRLLGKLIALFSVVRQIQDDLLRDKPETSRFEQLSIEERGMCLEWLYERLDQTKSPFTKLQQHAILNSLLQTKIAFSVLSFRRYAQAVQDSDISLLMNGGIYSVYALDLGGTNLTDFALKALGEVDNLPLETLNLSDMPNLRLTQPNLTLHFSNLMTLKVRNSRNIQAFPFDLPQLKHLYLENNWGLINALSLFTSRRPSQLFVIHLSGEAAFAQRIISLYFNHSNIDFEIDDLDLQSTILYWLADHRDDNVEVGCFLRKLLDRLLFLPRLECFAFSCWLDPEIYKVLSLLIHPIAKNINRILITGNQCDSEFMLSLLTYFPSVNQIDFKTTEDKEIFTVRLDELRHQVRVVAITEHYGAVRFEQSEAIDVFRKLGFAKGNTHQIDTFPDYFFFTREELSKLFGPHFAEKKDSVKNSNIFLSTQDENIIVPSVGVHRYAFFMLAEMVSAYVQEHPEKYWYIHCEEEIWDIPSYWKAYSQLSTERASLNVSFEMAQLLLQMGWKQNVLSWKEDELLCLLTLLRVPEEQEEEFCGKVMRALSDHANLSQAEKLLFLKEFSNAHTTVAILPSLIELYKKVTLFQGTTFQEAQDLADAYQKCEVQANVLLPDLWIDILKLAVKRASEQDAQTVRVLFNVVFSHNEAHIVSCSQGVLEKQEILSKIQLKLFVCELFSELSEFTEFIALLLSRIVIEDIDSSDPFLTASSLIDLPNLFNQKNVWSGEQERMTLPERVLEEGRKKHPYLLTTLVLKNAIYHWLAQEIDSSQAEEKFTKLLNQYSLFELFENLRRIEADFRKQAIADRLYIRIRSERIARALIHRLEQQEQSWTLPMYTSIGALLIRSDHERLKAYGETCCNNLLRLALTENSRLAYYKGRAAYLLKDYEKAQDYFRSAAEKQLEDRCLTNWQIHNINLWLKNCAKDVFKVTQPRRR